MRVWYNGSTSAFQADDAGSIPAARSICCLQAFGSGPGSSGVEHILGKDEVASSILALGSRFDEYAFAFSHRSLKIHVGVNYGKAKV